MAFRIARGFRHPVAGIISGGHYLGIALNGDAATIDPVIVCRYGLSRPGPGRRQLFWSVEILPALEPRQLDLSWPKSLRLGDGGTLRLTVGFPTSQSSDGSARSASYEAYNLVLQSIWICRE